MPLRIASVSAGAEATFSKGVRFKPSTLVDIDLTGTWVATVDLSRSLDGDDGTYFNVTQWTTNIQTQLRVGNASYFYRIGVNTGDYTSGTVEGRLYQ